MKLGFSELPSKEELKFVYSHTNDVVVATVLVPKSRKDIRTGTLDSIRRQTHLDGRSFEEAVRCPFKHEHYVAFIDRKGLAD